MKTTDALRALERLRDPQPRMSAKRAILDLYRMRIDWDTPHLTAAEAGRQPAEMRSGWVATDPRER